MAMTYGVEVGEVEGAERGAGRRADDPRVVEHDVEPAVAGHGEVHRRGDLGLVGDVAAGVGRAEVGGEGVAQVVLDVGEHDLGAVLDELFRGRLADAAGAARDHGHLAGQPLGVGARCRGVAAVFDDAGQRRRSSSLSPKDDLHRLEHLAD